MLERTRSGECLSDLRLDRLAAGLLTEADAGTARAHLGGCAICTARQAVLVQERDRFRERFPGGPPVLDAAGARDARRAAGPGWAERLRRWLFPATVVAAAAVAAMLLIPRQPGPAVSPGVTRAKGGLRLGFYVKRGEAIDPGRSGEALAAGDQVRFTVSAETGGFLIVASVDGAGQINVYHERDGRAAPLPAGRDQELPGAFELDEVAGREEVFAFLCERQVAVAEVRAALASTRLLGGCEIDRVTWEKAR